MLIVADKWMQKAFLHMEKESELHLKNQDLLAKYDELYRKGGGPKKQDLGKLS